MHLPLVLITCMFHPSHGHGHHGRTISDTERGPIATFFANACFSTAPLSMIRLIQEGRARHLTSRDLPTDRFFPVAEDLNEDVYIISKQSQLCNAVVKIQRSPCGSDWYMLYIIGGIRNLCKDLRGVPRWDIEAPHRCVWGRADLTGDSDHYGSV